MLAHDAFKKAVAWAKRMKLRRSGRLINRRAWLGSQIVQLKERVRDLEKLSRRTPPKTLLAECRRVEEAKGRLVQTQALLAEFEAEYASHEKGTP